MISSLCRIYAIHYTHAGIGTDKGNKRSLLDGNPPVFSHNGLADRASLCVRVGLPWLPFPVGPPVFDFQDLIRS